MKTNTQDDHNKVVNSEEESEPVNPQDNEYGDDTISKAERIKKGYSEGLRNDSNTANGPIDEKGAKEKEKN